MKFGPPQLTPEQAIERMFANCIPEPNTGCLLWLGSVSAGYPQIRYKGLMVKAHRLVCELTHGPLAAGQLAAHHCDVKSCLNPAHIQPGTYWSNWQDYHRRVRCRRV